MDENPEVETARLLMQIEKVIDKIQDDMESNKQVARNP